MDEMFEEIEKIINKDIPKNLTVEQKERIEKIQRRIKDARNKTWIQTMFNGS